MELSYTRKNIYQQFDSYVTVYKPIGYVTVIYLSTWLRVFDSIYYIYLPMVWLVCDSVLISSGPD